MSQVVQAELVQYAEDDTLQFTIDSDGKLNELRVTLVPPQGTPYEDGNFFLTINIPPQYPSTPPTIKFETKIYHPNINEEGKICLEQLKSEWRPDYTLRHAIDFIYCLLQNPNWETPLVQSIGAQHEKNPEEFEKTAREWTEKYAC